MAADISSALQQLDAQIEQTIRGWNIYSTLISIVFICYLFYPLFFTPDPDVHPMLLARQATASQVRQSGESAIFRSLETPHSYPLKTGLNVKDPGAPRWSSGRDGDLRDVWKKALLDPVDPDGKPNGAKGKISTVLGKEEVIEHSFEKLTAEINAIGQHLRKHGGSRIAIYLPNSVELLVTLFASVFYGLTPILVPQNYTLDNIAGILAETKADALVVGAGALPLNDLIRKYPSLKQVIWVVERTSRHMDWNEVPEGEGGKADIAVWHDIIDEKSSSAAEFPTEIPGGNLPNIVMVVEDAMSALDSFEIVEYTQKNFVAAIGAQLSVLPRKHRLSPSDLLTPLAPLTDSYPLVITLAAIFSNASLALTPVSGPRVPYHSAFQGASPTIVIAGTQTMAAYCRERERALTTSKLDSINHWWKARSLKAGIMPKAPAAALITQPRLIYTYFNASPSTAPLHHAHLFNLRLFTNSRIIYAFTDPHVAGAVSQTNMLDYRTPHSDSDRRPSHCGPPLSCLELNFRDSEGLRNEGGKAEGQLVLSGPTVVGETAVADQLMAMTNENTLIST